MEKQQKLWITGASIIISSIAIIMAIIGVASYSSVELLSGNKVNDVIITSPALFSTGNFTLGVTSLIFGVITFIASLALFILIWMDYDFILERIEVEALIYYGVIFISILAFALGISAIALKDVQVLELTTKIKMA